MRVIPGEIVNENRGSSSAIPPSSLPYPHPSQTSYQGYGVPGQFLPRSPCKQDSILPTTSPNRIQSTPPQTSILGSFTAGVQKTLNFDSQDGNELSTKRKNGVVDWLYGTVKNTSDQVVGLWSESTQHELETCNTKESDSLMNSCRKHWLFKAIRNGGDQLVQYMSSSQQTHTSDGVSIGRGARQSKQVLPFNSRDVDRLRYE